MRKSPRTGLFRPMSMSNPVTLNSHANPPHLPCSFQLPLPFPDVGHGVCIFATKGRYKINRLRGAFSSVSHFTHQQLLCVTKMTMSLRSLVAFVVLSALGECAAVGPRGFNYSALSLREVGARNTKVSERLVLLYSFPISYSHCGS